MPPPPQVWDFDTNGHHDLIGELQTSLGQLKEAAATPAKAGLHTLDLVAPPSKKKGGAAGGKPGTIVIRQIMIRDGPTPQQQLFGELPVWGLGGVGLGWGTGWWLVVVGRSIEGGGGGFAHSSCPCVPCACRLLPSVHGRGVRGARCMANHLRQRWRDSSDQLPSKVFFCYHLTCLLYSAVWYRIEL